MPTIPSGPLECPREDCLSHQGDVASRVIHYASHRTKHGIRKRRRCMVCGATFSSLTGTAYAGLRRRKSDLDRVLQMHSEGMTKAAISRVVRVSPGTVARWIERAAAHARLFHDARTQIEEAVEIQLDELSCGGVGDAKAAWAFSGIEVSTRLWAGLLVAKRTLRATKQFVREVKYTIGTVTEWTLFTSDCFKYYKPAMSAAFKDDAAVYVQVKNRYRVGKIVRSTWTRTMGSELAHDDALARNSDSHKPNTAFIQRLNLTKRMCCSLLRRRNPSPARKIESIQSALGWIREALARGTEVGGRIAEAGDGAAGIGAEGDAVLDGSGVEEREEGALGIVRRGACVGDIGLAVQGTDEIRASGAAQGAVDGV